VRRASEEELPNPAPFPESGEGSRRRPRRGRDRANSTSHVERSPSPDSGEGRGGGSLSREPKPRSANQPAISPAIAGAITRGSNARGPIHARPRSRARAPGHAVPRKALQARGRHDGRSHARNELILRRARRRRLRGAPVVDRRRGRREEVAVVRRQAEVDRRLRLLELRSGRDAGGAVRIAQRSRCVRRRRDRPDGERRGKREEEAAQATQHAGSVDRREVPEQADTYICG
jgi:hypothetical protein